MGLWFVGSALDEPEQTTAAPKSQSETHLAQRSARRQDRGHCKFEVGMRRSGERQLTRKLHPASETVGDRSRRLTDRSRSMYQVGPAMADSPSQARTIGELQIVTSRSTAAERGSTNID
jgi:hypothetical protein